MRDTAVRRTQMGMFVISYRHVYMGSQIIIRNLVDAEVWWGS